MKKFHFILGWNKFENINLPKKKLYEQFQNVFSKGT
jgi:hypothetical protein